MRFDPMSYPAAALDAHRRRQIPWVCVAAFTLATLPATAAVAAIPDPVLKRSEELDLRRLGKVSEDERALLRVEWRGALGGVHEKNAVQEMLERLRRMEGTVVALSALVRNMPTASANAPAPVVPPVPVVAPAPVAPTVPAAPPLPVAPVALSPPASAVAPATPVPPPPTVAAVPPAEPVVPVAPPPAAPSPDPVATAPVAAPAPAKPPVVVAKKAPPVPEETDQSDPRLIFANVGAAVLVVLWWLRRREAAKAQRAANQLEAELEERPRPLAPVPPRRPKSPDLPTRIDPVIGPAHSPSALLPQSTPPAASAAGHANAAASVASASTHAHEADTVVLAAPMTLAHEDVVLNKVSEVDFSLDEPVAEPAVELHNAPLVAASISGPIPAPVPARAPAPVPEPAAEPMFALDLDPTPNPPSPNLAPTIAVSAPSSAPLSAPEFHADEDILAGTSNESTLQLAEIMLSMGLEQGAAQALVEYTEANPRHSLYHWLKLLGIYRKRGLQDEFMETAERLRKNFNIQAEYWAKPETGDTPSLERFHRVAEHVQMLWSRPAECGDYLRHLLEDNRGGERTGFPQPVAEEIMLLIEILRINEA